MIGDYIASNIHVLMMSSVFVCITNLTCGLMEFVVYLPKLIYKVPMCVVGIVRPP